MSDRKLNELPLKTSAVILYGEESDGSQSRIEREVLLKDPKETADAAFEGVDDDYYPYTEDRKEVILLCGQPSVLFGAGTPSESVVPVNWKQYDMDSDEGYNWNGTPSALGQFYVNTNATSGGGLYIAVRDGIYGLKWQNV